MALCIVLFQCLAWVSTKFTNRSLDYPDIEIVFISGSPASDGGNHIRKVSMFSVPVMLVKFMLDKVQNPVQCFCQVMKPKVMMKKKTGSLHSHFMLQAQNSDNLWQMYRPLAYRDTWSVIPMLLRPKSRGRVLLRSSNPYDNPIFHAGYFTHPEDIKVCDSSW